MRAPAVVCCDLDGVIWRGDDPVPGVAAGVDRLRAAGSRVTFLTNNSSHRVADVIDRLRRCEIDAVAEDVATSAQAAAALLADTLSVGARVLACAGPGVSEALTAVGFRVVETGPADAVVVGWHREFDFVRLDRAARTVRAGARFVATNVDSTFPASEGLLPGNGALVAAVATASGVVPEVAGKPEPPTVSLVQQRFGLSGVVVGDRPSTDGSLAEALGWPFGLVLTGVAGAPGGELVPDPPPEFVAADFGALAELLVD